ncbi:type II toxin-antitoxin system PemK/MazF family toxin [Georgenia sp. Z1491]|uniref:type II toxin-antitoxin system PemK/MazF family toxin n=1 Tax=Georgenia sp. Z1491 TaxID=3416707 RepID=UPI003CF5D9CE
MAERRVDLSPGDVWWASPRPTIGRKQGGRRPVLVVAGHEYLATVTTLALVVPLTSSDRGWPNHVEVRGHVDLPRTSFAMTEQVRVVSRDRLAAPLGRVSPRCLVEVRSWLVDHLTD